MGIKAYVGTDCDWVMLAFAETPGQAKSLFRGFDDDTDYVNITVARVPELDDIYDMSKLVDAEEGPTWCDECDPGFANHELWHYKGHSGEHCFTNCQL